MKAAHSAAVCTRTNHVQIGVPAACTHLLIINYWLELNVKRVYFVNSEPC